MRQEWLIINKLEKCVNGCFTVKNFSVARREIILMYPMKRYSQMIGSCVNHSSQIRERYNDIITKMLYLISTV